ncbi:MAG: response regulator transcription factor [Lachnospiraceae bacterium]|nr:response regulator transcription factor [Lachnospiraceae bacterium]
MRIALCDDQKMVYEELGELLQKFSEEHPLKNEFMYFEKPSALFEYMGENPLDIVFMDLEFCDEAEDGILWLKRMKKSFPHTIVIILTAYENRYKEGYEARAFRFMTKPLEEKELFAYLQVSMEELQLNQSVSITRRGLVHSILVQDIFYLSAHFGGSELWTKENRYFCEESLVQWEQQLPSSIFFRCHSKYLVNLSRVLTFEKQMITLVNGEKIPVSRRKWKAFQLAYMRFDTKGYQV